MQMAILIQLQALLRLGIAFLMKAKLLMMCAKSALWWRKLGRPLEIL
jgi:hypothetical protein